MLSDEQRSRIRHDVFIADMLFVPTILFAKLSSILFIHQLIAKRAHVILAWLTVVFITLWGIASMFVVGLQCGFRPAWLVEENSGAKCVDIVSLPFQAVSTCSHNVRRANPGVIHRIHSGLSLRHSIS